MTNLVLIDKKTKKVVNVIVPPSGSDAYFLPSGVDGVESATATIGDIYDPETETFSRDPEIIEQEKVDSQTQVEQMKARDEIIGRKNKIEAAIVALKDKKSLSIEEQGTLANLENSLENIQQKIVKIGGANED